MYSHVTPTHLVIVPSGMSSMQAACRGAVLFCAYGESPLSAVQNLNESLAKLDIKGGVDDGVDCAVDVTKPGKSCVEFGWDMAVCIHYVCDEEWQPAYNKHT